MIGDEVPRRLVLAWRPSIDASVHFILPFAICICWKVNVNLRVFLVGVYLSTSIQIRSRQFEKISSEILGISDPVACFGDFNALCSFEEKEGGIPINRRSLADFNAFINDLRLIDIGFTGPAFTWSNKHVDHTIIYERLDRFLLNDPWIRQWPESIVEHKDSSSSDHRPIILFPTPPSAPTKRLFRFDNRWIDYPEARNLITKAWKLYVRGTPMFRLKEKLKETRHLLFHWSTTGVTNSAKAMREIEKKIATTKAQSPVDWENLLHLEIELADAARKEEMYWKLRLSPMVVLKERPN
ncbi:hypothetical protein LINPERPRIM_LOCUS19216 [Linum perenne]